MHSLLYVRFSCNFTPHTPLSCHGLSAVQEWQPEWELARRTVMSSPHAQVVGSLLDRQRGDEKQLHFLCAGIKSISPGVVGHQIARELYRELWL
jgi:hypothetical protein